MATSNKYDRQLRLWGSIGQERLSKCKIICINATCCGTETLKNLILPGIGQYEIIDDYDYDNNDNNNNTENSDDQYTSNFFLTKQQEGASSSSSTGNVTTSSRSSSSCCSSRAEMACQYLSELNPDVIGTYKHVGVGADGGSSSSSSLNDFDFDNYIQNELKKLTVAVTTTTSEEEKNDNDNNNDNDSSSSDSLLLLCNDIEPPSLLVKICTIGERYNIPVIVTFSYGLIGIVRIQLSKPSYPIMNPKPRTTIPDIRLLQPPRALYEMLNELDQNNNDNDNNDNDNEKKNADDEKSSIRKKEDGTVTTSSDDCWSYMDNATHKHIPYPLILLKAQSIWKSKHGNTLPSNFVEKQEFVQLIKTKMSRNYADEFNYQEAITNAYLAYTQPTIDVEHIRQLKTKMMMTKVSSSSSSSAASSTSCHKFFILLDALEQFIQQQEIENEKEGDESSNSNSSTSSYYPPCTGKIPDMTSSTELYIRLQRIYQDEATRHIQQIRKYIDQKKNNHNNNTNNTPVITDDDITTFCQNVQYLDALNVRTIQEEYCGVAVANDNNKDNNDHNNVVDNISIPDDIIDDLTMSTMEGIERAEHTPLLWYFCFRACQLFHTKYGRYPGSSSRRGDSSHDDDDDDDSWMDDAIPLQECLVCIIKRYKLMENDLIKDTLLKPTTTTLNNKMIASTTTTTTTTTPHQQQQEQQQQQQHSSYLLPSDYCIEMTRYNNGEIHCIGSIVGGIASQEAIKIITQQYVPINHTTIYNGIAAIGGTYRF